MQDEDGGWDWENDRPMAAGAGAGAVTGDADRPQAVDSNGTQLADGDSVVLIKDLKVKGAGQTLKRGTVVKNIRLTENPEEFDCRTDGIKGLVLRCEFVKKR